MQLMNRKVSFEPINAFSRNNYCLKFNQPLKLKTNPVLRFLNLICTLFEPFYNLLYECSNLIFSENSLSAFEFFKNICLKNKF